MSPVAAAATKRSALCNFDCFGESSGNAHGRQQPGEDSEVQQYQGQNTEGCEKDDRVTECGAVRDSARESGGRMS